MEVRNETKCCSLLRGGVCTYVLGRVQRGGGGEGGSTLVVVVVVVVQNKGCRDHGEVSISAVVVTVLENGAVGEDLVAVRRVTIVDGHKHTCRGKWI